MSGWSVKGTQNWETGNREAYRISCSPVPGTAKCTGNHSLYSHSALVPCPERSRALLDAGEASNPLSQSIEGIAGN